MFDLRSNEFRWVLRTVVLKEDQIVSQNKRENESDEKPLCFGGSLCPHLDSSTLIYKEQDHHHS